MNRKSKLALVSSTPHPTKKHKLAFEFEKDISPITTKAVEIKKVTNQSQAINKRTKSTAEVESVVLKKKKCTAKQEKESASSAALKEMGVKIGFRSTNVLSKSRNLYNMFPQLVILDSDDETELQPKQVTTTKVGLKKKDDTIKPSPSSLSPAGIKDLSKKRGLTKQSDECITESIILDSDDETELQAKQVTTTKVGLKKKDGTIKPSPSSLSPVGIKDLSKKRGLTKQSDECVTVSNQPKTKMEKKPNTKRTSAKETPQPSSSKPRTIKKNTLSKGTTAGSTSEQVVKAKDKQAEISQLISDSDDEDSMFPDLSSARKNMYLKCSSLKNLIDQNRTIKWTPRSKTKHLNMIKEKDSESESVSGESDDCLLLKTLNVSDLSNKCANKENFKNTSINNVPTNNEKNQHENPFPKELLSRFSEIVFRPSKQSNGAVVAPSLATGSFEFGYVELDEAKLFTGKLKNVTFVLIEGQVKAVFQGKSVSLSPGDILHINKDSGYLLHNLGPGHARLLYAKEKHS